MAGWDAPSVANTSPEWGTFEQSANDAAIAQQMPDEESNQSRFAGMDDATRPNRETALPPRRPREYGTSYPIRQSLSYTYVNMLIWYRTGSRTDDDF